MIRRPPTVIALEEQDLESHFQRLYLRHTLTVDFEQLRLDEDESFGDFQTDQSPMNSCISSNPSDVDIDTTDPGQGGSSCFGHKSSPRDRSHPARCANPQSTSVIKSCLKSPNPNQLQFSVHNTISPGVHSHRAERSVDPPRLKVKFALSPQEITHQNGKDHLSPEEETGKSNSRA
ncbi:hypothetical protein N7475_005426 [Penicillium sp. IBT 31633x]|nr:hypothetical protein N7475_005426 [Penicillium sp. IBT 31633x]